MYTLNFAVLIMAAAYILLISIFSRTDDMPSLVAMRILSGLVSILTMLIAFCAMG